MVVTLHLWIITIIIMINNNNYALYCHQCIRVLCIWPIVWDSPQSAETVKKISESQSCFEWTSQKVNLDLTFKKVGVRSAVSPLIDELWDDGSGERCNHMALFCLEFSAPNPWVQSSADDFFFSQAWEKNHSWGNFPKVTAYMVRSRWSIWTSLQEAGKCFPIIPTICWGRWKTATESKQGLCSIFRHVWGRGSTPPPPFLLFEQRHLYLFASEELRVYAKPMFGILVKIEVKIEVLVSAFTRSLLYSDDSLMFPLLFHFAQKVSFSSPMPRCCPGKVRTLPVSPPGQRAPSHMPCRLARSSVPLNWLIATWK